MVKKHRHNGNGLDYPRFVGLNAVIHFRSGHKGKKEWYSFD